MEYEEQIKELDQLLKQCDEMQLTIDTNLIWAANDISTYHEHAGDLKKTDEKWCTFLDNFKTFFVINPNPELEEDFASLSRKNGFTVSRELLSELKTFIKHIKNVLKIKKYNN